MKLIDVIADELKTVKILSIDIFNTLLFRMTRRDSMVFERMYELAPELFPEYMDAADWRQIRMNTITFIKNELLKRKIEDVTIDDIYGRLPAIISNRKEIMCLEVECEAQLCFVNDEIAEVIFAASSRGIKVVLTSDMYLRKDDLKHILVRNGFDTEVIGEIYVSGEVRATKRSGKLFDELLRNERTSPSDILHIGDDLHSDYRMAKKKGIRAFLYSKISDARMKYPFLRIEERIYGNICDELYVLRILAASQKNSDDKYKEWHDIGAMQIGPMLTMAVEWVLNLAEENGIFQIFPLMREGKFLTKMLLLAQRKRGWKGKIEPMYISRKALYPALLSVIEDKDILYQYSSNHQTVGNLLNMLELPLLIEKYSEHLSRTLHETRYIYHGTISLHEELREILSDDDFLCGIRERSQEKDTELFQYLEQLGLTKNDYITFDIGWRGNVQNAIQRIFNKNGVRTRGLHLLINAKNQLVKNGSLDNNCDIRGYTGNFGKNERVLSDIPPYVCELFLTCDEGSTVGYAEKGGRIIPLLSTPGYSAEQLNRLFAIQNGILAFQREFFRLSSKKKICCDEKEVASIVGRLLSYPTAKEAAMLGSMTFEQNFGIEKQWEIISNKKLKQYSDLGYEEFVYQKKARQDEWYAGMDAMISLFDIYKTVLNRYTDSIFYRMLGFVKHVLKNVQGKFVLVCAGARCKMFLEFLNSANLLSKVEFIIDNDEYLWNTYLNGIPIVPMGSETDIADFVITVFTKKTIDSLRPMLSKTYGHNVKIHDRAINRYTQWENV